MDIFRTLGSRSLSVTAMFNFSGKANTSIHGLGEDKMASYLSVTEAPHNIENEINRALGHLCEHIG